MQGGINNVELKEYSFRRKEYFVWAEKCFVMKMRLCWRAVTFYDIEILEGFEKVFKN